MKGFREALRACGPHLRTSSLNDMAIAAHVRVHVCVCVHLRVFSPAAVLFVCSPRATAVF